MDLFRKVSPEGWRMDSLDGSDYYYLISSPPPQRLMVTVDFERRVFRAGLSTTGPTHSTASYQGRGWREALVGDAIAWLGGVSK